MNANVAVSVLSSLYSALPAYLQERHKPDVNAILLALQNKAVDDTQILKEATLPELLNEISCRFDGAVFCGGRKEIFTKFHRGSIHTCIGLAEVLRLGLMSQIQTKPYDDGAAASRSPSDVV